MRSRTGKLLKVFQWRWKRQGQAAVCQPFFNAANELAVRKFLQKKISFLDIYEIIGQSMSRHTAVKDPDLDQILEIEKETYRWIESRW